MSQVNSEQPRLATGVPGLDRHLGGGLLPGTLAVVVGAAGIGKTQLGLQFAQAGLDQEGSRGVVLDLNARGDSQHQAEYAQRMFGWRIEGEPANVPPNLQSIFPPSTSPNEYLQVFEYSGKRVTQQDLGMEAWHDWQAQLSVRIELVVAFCYRHFIRGVRRVVLDGVEPVEKQSESIQFEMLEYIYHQVLRKESDWLARELFRQKFRLQMDEVLRHAYDARQIGGLLLYTSHETMLGPMIERPLQDGDLLAAANTILYLGKVRQGDRFARGLYIAKHRGSVCSDEILPYQITDAGLELI
jgi:hypothetical protein